MEATSASAASNSNLTSPPPQNASTISNLAKIFSKIKIEK